MEAPATPIELRRFLLSSVGFHLVMGWVLMTIGLPGGVPADRPLQIRLVEPETPTLAPAAPLPVRSSRRKMPGPTHSTDAGPDVEVSPHPLQSRLEDRVTVAAPAALEKIDRIDAEDERRASPPRSVSELVKGVDLPLGGGPASGDRVVRSGADGGPKPIPLPGGVAMVPGATSHGRGGAGVPGSGSASGPAQIGAAGTGDGRREAGGVTGTRRIGGEYAMTLAPTVRVGPSQRGFGQPGGGRPGGGAGGGFARPDHGVNPPPVYPPVARERGYEGTVYLRVQVRQDGRVGQLAVDRSSGYEVLDLAAADSVKAWTFLPARKDGRPVMSWVLLPVKFELR
jgi:TonB family protein